MRVLLLNPPFSEMLLRDNYCCHTSKGDYVWAPTDLLYVSGNLNHPNIQLKVIDAIVEKKSPERTISETEAFHPDVIVALSGTASFVSDMKLLTQIKSQINCRLYIMGNVAAFEPALFLKNFPSVDGVFHNFFDEKILQFVLNPSQLSKSISARQPDGSVVLGEINYLHKHEFPQPLPPQYFLFPLHLYSTPLSLRSPMASVITSFGCPYVCKFCVASGLNLYHRSIQNLEIEFDEMYRNGIKEIFFMDSTFNTSAARVREICELMLRKNYQFTWSCNVHSHRNLYTTFTLMKRAGCHTIQIGVEAGSDDSRKEFAPQKTKGNLKDTFDAAHRAGLRTLGYFIIGFPEEGAPEVSETIDFAIELNPFFASFSTLVPDYGTAFYLEAKDKNMLNEEMHSSDNSGSAMLSNTKLSKEERGKLLKTAYRRFYLRPSQLYKYISDFSMLPLYFRNGKRVLAKFIT